MQVFMYFLLCPAFSFGGTLRTLVYLAFDLLRLSTYIVTSFLKLQYITGKAHVRLISAIV